jgi:CubicO group peptidase (beta-lactamase class C family)
MRKSIYKTLALLIALILRFKAFSADGTVKSIFTQAQSDSLKKYLRVFPANTQLSIAMVENDKVIYAGIITDKDSFHVVENRDSVFEIGSLSKVFTSVLLSTFVNKGILKTSDSVQQFFNFKLKQCSLGGKEITLQMLANHTSGLPRIDMSMLNSSTDMNNPYKNYDEKSLDDYLQNKMKLDTVPGTKFSYSNLGGGLLGYILCKKANKTYEELLQQYIFLPLGMKSSTTDISLIKDRLVKGHSSRGDVTANWTFTDATAGAGAIKSCATDMVNFMRANFRENAILELPRNQTFLIKQGKGIGLGWMINTTQNGDSLYWHNGGTGGYRSCLVMSVHKKSGVVILSNLSSFHPLNANIDKLCVALSNTLH